MKHTQRLLKKAKNISLFFFFNEAERSATVTLSISLTPVNRRKELKKGCFSE